MDSQTREHLHETPWVVTVPLVLLAIPSVIIGWPYVESVLFGDHFGDAIYVLSPAHDVLGEMQKGFHGPSEMVTHGLLSAPFWLAMAGVFVAAVMYLWLPHLPSVIADRLKFVYRALVAKYGFDRFNEVVFAGGARGLGAFFWRIGDELLIDGLLINGTARLVGWLSGVIRHVQTGLLYHYAFAMIIGLVFLITWIVFKPWS